MYQTVIFDLDGTLLDTIQDLSAAAADLCRERGWPVRPTGEIRTMVGHGMENFIAQLSPPEAQAPAQIADSLQRFRGYYARCLTDTTRPYPGMAALAEGLYRKGVRLAVCSNKDHRFCQTLMDTFYPGLFTVVLGKGPDLPPKPDPAAVRRILRELDGDGGRTLFAGDSATDVATGHNAGLPVCACAWGYRPRETLGAADFLAETPAELEAVIMNG